MDEEKPQTFPITSVSTEGVLLGVVLDLSDSMRLNIQNNSNGQLSRIESLSQEFSHVMEDAKLLMDTMITEEEVPCRMFVYGFGFRSEGLLTWTNPTGDVFSIINNLDEELKYYKPLQPELEHVWFDEVEQMLQQGQIEGNAKEELQVFVQNELREQAIQAEQQRSLAKFQHWCESICQKIDAYSIRMRNKAAQQEKMTSILIPMIIGLQWILHVPMLVMAYLNTLFEAWLQRKLIMLRDNADKYAHQQSEKVVFLTQSALAKYHSRISNLTQQAMIKFLDEEAFKVIRFYNQQESVKVVKQCFDKSGLKNVYTGVSDQIRAIMSPHADASWERSIFLLKRAAKALKIKLRWDILKEKTIRCAHQIVWETISPEIRNMAKELTKERFTRAILITIVQSVKDQETTLSLQEVANMMQKNNQIQATTKELPIFGSSPIGITLTKTFNRLWHEVHLPQNRGLHPVIMIISDGESTDSNLVDLLLLADQIKQLGITIICCCITNKNTTRPWVLERNPGWFWPEATRLMFSMSSTIEDYPQLADRLKESRFRMRSHAKLFIQPNHAGYLRSFIEAVLLPLQKEQRATGQMQGKLEYNKQQ